MIDKDVHELNAFFGAPKIGGANSPLPKYNKPAKMVADIAQPEWPFPTPGDQYPRIAPWPFPTDRYLPFPSPGPKYIAIPEITEAQKEAFQKAMQDHIDQETAKKAADELQKCKPNTQAVKADSGKTDWSLVPFDAVEEIAKVLEFGAKKYAAHNWKNGGGFSWVRVCNSMLRHMFAWMRGEDNDPESGLSHIAHCGCNVLFLMHYIKNKKKYDKDDRV